MLPLLWLLLLFLASGSTLTALVDQKMQTPSGCFAKSKTGVDGKVAEGLLSQQGACQHACGGGKLVLGGSNLESELHIASEY